jgi:hypothetical protein
MMGGRKRRYGEKLVWAFDEKEERVARYRRRRAIYPKQSVPMLE